jgi:hypothetical protein
MVFRRSEEAKLATRIAILGRITKISDNIDNLENQLDDGRNWFARFGIRRNLRTRKAQLERYLRRYERLEREGWI